MQGFTPALSAYRAAPQADIVRVALRAIARPQRTVKKDFGGFERVRLVKVLAGFVGEEAIPPVKVHELPEGPFRFGLRDGFHRFYASVAAGFDHISAVITTYLPD